MSTFNKYFQDELSYLRDLGREFSEAYPAVAPMLADRGADPDVERLLEGVAFLTGRIRQKLDDEIPEVIASIASLLFPHLVRPLPAATIMELLPVISAIRERSTVQSGTEFGAVEMDGTHCRFRSVAPCDIAPWSIEDVRMETLPAGRQQLRIMLQLHAGTNAADVAPDVLRVHVAGDVSDALRLLAWLHEECEDVVVTQASGPGMPERVVSLGRAALETVGFADDDALLPLGRATFPGFRLLEEYYTLPHKFAFFGIRGIKRIAELREPSARFSVCIRLRRRLTDMAPLEKDSLKLHCVPAVNIFETTAEPLRISPTRERYLVRPAGLPVRHGEVYAVRHAQTIPRGTNRRVTIPSFYEFSHAGNESDLYYALHYAPSVVGEGTDVTISFGTPEDGGTFPDAEMVSLEILATNRALGGGLRAGEIRVPTPTSPSIATFRNLYTTTQHVSAPFGRELHWRVVAHSAMGIRGLTELEVLKSALDVYNIPAIVNRQAARANELRIEALKALRVSAAERLYRGSVVRGVDIELDVDEAGFAGEGDLWLFGAIVEQFFAHYVSLNAFSRTTINGLSSKVRYAWPARSGTLTMI